MLRERARRESLPDLFFHSPAYSATVREALAQPVVRTLVQTHPSRLGRAQALAEQLDATIILDPLPMESPSPWRSYRECVEAAEGTGWTLIIQDDAIPHPQLLEVCERIATRHPTRVVCLFHARYPQINAMRLAMARDRGYAYAEIRASRFVPAVAILWPPHQANRLRKWLPTHAVAADDEMISRFLAQPKYRDTYLATVPSLVDHDDAVPSLMGTKWNGSRTALFSAPPDALSIDWESDALAHL